METRTTEVATIQGPSTHVARFPGGSSWPAWEYDEQYVIVDLRMFEPTSKGAQVASHRLTFQPDELRKVGLPEETIQAASTSTPIQGFVFSLKKPP